MASETLAKASPMKRVGAFLIIAGLVLGGVVIACTVSHMLPRTVVIIGALGSSVDIGAGYLMLKLRS